MIYLQQHAKGHFAAASRMILDGDATALFLDQQFAGSARARHSICIAPLSVFSKNVFCKNIFSKD